jgi:5-methylcytosine-specific restriction endonuclease McrA
MSRIHAQAAETTDTRRRRAWRRARMKRNPHCQYCNKRVRDDATIDHVVPLSKGGADAEENWVLSCFSCNNQKGNT